MRSELIVDEGLAQRLPLPLAQLYRRAHNAKTALERHYAANCLWEVTLKLLGSVAIVEYAQERDPDPQLAERLHNLARPALGHWWEFVRRLLPLLGDQNRGKFPQVRDLVLGRTRDDLPRAAGLDAALREALEGRHLAQSTVRLTELFDRLVQYRNSEVGHGAPGLRPESFYDRMSRALLAGMGEILARLDVLAGRRLIYIAGVRQVAGNWLVDRDELIGENPRGMEPWKWPRGEAPRLPQSERVYLQLDGSPKSSEPLPESLRELHPLLIYDAEGKVLLFLNARRGRQRTEYLCYTTGRHVDRADLGPEQRQLLALVLGIPVSEAQASDWQKQSQEDDAPLPGGSTSAPTLGEFELLSELGHGAMGLVYRAWQPSLGRQVALKKLLRTGDPKAEARFAREIHVLGHVEHPNLVKIFTSGSEGEDWFYAMELVEGAPLSALSDRLQTQSATATDCDLKSWQSALSTVCEEARKNEKPLADSHHGQSTPSAPGIAADSSEDGLRPPLTERTYVNQIVTLLIQVARAAHALHEARIIHRDIKPGNIIVSADGSQAVLMDLGLAQLADEDDNRLTVTKEFVGTLRYASPQQVLAVRKLDRRSDVYSLGATLWELLALRPLLGATNQTPTPELMERILYEEPAPLRQMRPGISRDLEAVAHKCLEKKPEDRYATAAELARDLQRYLDGKPVRARPVRSWERAVKWVLRHPTKAGLVASCFFLAIVLSYALLSYFHSNEVASKNHELSVALRVADVERKKADEERNNAEEARNEAEAGALVLKLLVASKMEDVQESIKKIDAGYRKWANPLLEKAYKDAADESPQKVKAGLALLPVDSSKVGFLYDRLLEAEPRDVPAIQGALQHFDKDFVEKLFSKLAETVGAVTLAKKDLQAKRRANAAAVLLRAGNPDRRIWSLLEHVDDDSSSRSYLVHALRPLGIKQSTLAAQLQKEKVLSIKRALVLSLGEKGEDDLLPTERQKLIDQLLRLYEEPDPGLHGAVEWLLHQWGEEKRLERAVAWAKRPDGTAPAWYVEHQGQSMVMIPGPRKFWKGSPQDEVGRFDSDEIQAEKDIRYSFAIASREVTVEEFRRFSEKHLLQKEHVHTDKSPVINVTWDQAALYCNWLSKMAELPEDQLCYTVDKGLPIRAREHRHRAGYRLPTEDEWECACRAGSRTSRYYGDTKELLNKYAYYGNFSPHKAMPVGGLKPNDFGLFDMLGNAFEWCHDLYSGKEGKPNETRALRGGSWAHESKFSRSAFRTGGDPHTSSQATGFRVARTFITDEKLNQK